MLQKSVMISIKNEGQGGEGMLMGQPGSNGGCDDDNENDNELDDDLDDESMTGVGAAATNDEISDLLVQQILSKKSPSFGSNLSQQQHLNNNNSRHQQQQFEDEFDDSNYSADFDDDTAVSGADKDLHRHHHHHLDNGDNVDDDRDDKDEPLIGLKQGKYLN